MPVELSFAVKVFAALFAIMNPIANIPVFLSLTEGSTGQQQRRIALVVFIGVTIGSVIAASAGGVILQVFGLTVNDFRLAGGLLVLLIAIDMLHGSSSRQHHPSDKEMGDSSDDQDVAVYPLTIPLLIGPGAITTLIVFGQTAMAQHQLVGLVAGLGVFLVLLGASLFVAPYLGKVLSPKVTAITKRLMGMILAAIAMEMMIDSLQIAFHIARP